MKNPFDPITEPASHRHFEERRISTELNKLSERLETRRETICQEVKDEVDQKCAEMDAEINSWIPISKSPESIGWYHVYTNDDLIMTAQVAANGWWTRLFGEYYGDLGKPFVRDSKSVEREVTHYRPLIQKPKTT